MAELSLWEVTDTDTGRKMTVESVEPPNEAEAAELWSQYDAEEKEPIVATGLEPVTMMATAGPAKIASGFAGIAGEVVDQFGEDTNAGGRWQAATESALTDDIDTQQGRDELEIIANMPVIKQLGELGQEWVNDLRGRIQSIGDGGAITLPDALGGGEIVSEENIPLLQAGLETATIGAPEAVMTAMGIQGAGAARGGLKKTADTVEEFKGPVFDAAKEKTNSIIEQVSGTPDYRIYDEGIGFTPESIEIIGDLYTQKLQEKPRIAKQAQRLKAEGLPDAEVDAYLKKALGLDGVLSPTEMARHNTFARVGVTNTRADITGSTDDWRIQRDAMKQTNDVSKRVAQQDLELAAAAGGMREATRGISNPYDRQGTSKRLYTVIDDVLSGYDNAVTDAYTKARNNMPDAEIQPLRLVHRFKELGNKRAKSEGDYDTIQGILQNVGLLDSKGNPLQIDKLNTNMTSTRGFGRQSVGDMEQIRQLLNAEYQNASPTGRQIIHDLKEAIDDDVVRVVGKDVFKEARAAKIGFHKLIQRDKGKRDITKSSFFEDIVSGKVDPDKIIDQLKTAKVKHPDLVHLRNFLVKESGDSGKQLWSDMRAQIMDDAATAATKNMGKQEGGVQVFDGQAFKNHIYSAVGGVDNAKRRNLFFNPAEQQMINDMADIKKLRTAPGSVHSGSGATGYAMEQVLAQMQMMDPVTGAALRTGNKATRWLSGALLNRTNKKDIKSPTRQTDAAIKKQVKENQQN